MHTKEIGNSGSLVAVLAVAWGLAGLIGSDPATILPGAASSSPVSASPGTHRPGSHAARMPALRGIELDPASKAASAALHAAIDSAALQSLRMVAPKPIVPSLTLGRPPDGVFVSGAELAAVPEPSLTPLLAVGLGVGLGLRMRRRSSRWTRQAA